MSPGLCRVEKILLFVGHFKNSVCYCNQTNKYVFVLAGLDFEALLIKPKEVKDGGKLPLIVTPHGWLLSFGSVVCNCKQNVVSLIDS